MYKKIKKPISLILAAAMTISMCSVNNGKNVEAKTEQHTVFDEIEKTNISKDKLDTIAEAALEDGEKAAKQVNHYDDEADYEAALNSALTSYYETEDFEELKAFESTVDNRSSEIVEGYKDAAEERAKGDDNGFEAGTVIAVFDKESTREEINAVCEAENGELQSIYQNFEGDYVTTISISLGQTVDMAADAYNTYSIVDAADGNDYLDIEESAFGSTNDAGLGNQYYLNNIHVKEAWDYVSSHEHNKVLVGVIDTGAQVDHPELKNILSPKSADITGDSPVLLTDCDTPAKNQHGTAVAGIIAAEANNGIQMAGVASCYNNDVVEILAVQASTYFESYGEYRFSMDNLYKAMDYCVEQGTKVVNMSLGSYGYNKTQEDLVNKMTDAGIIVVCSAGNESTSSMHYPSDYDKAIAVVSTTSQDVISDFSDYGSQKDICAPGSYIYMLNHTSGVTTGSGTSMASPVVSAVAAMMCSINSDLNYFDVKRIMANTATQLATLDSIEKVPYGLVNAAKCIEYAVGYTPTTLFEHKEEAYKNLAFGKSVTASSVYNEADFPLSNLVDGDTKTKMITESSSGQTVTVDLGQAYDIDKINIYYERFSTTGYSIQVSEDNENWREVASGEKAAQVNKTFEIEKQKARYVKLEFIDNETYVLLTELEVFGYTDENAVLTDILSEKEKPSEALDVSANWIFPNAAHVVWKEDANRASKDYTYNIYVDGVLTYSNLTSGAQIVSGLSAGTHTFKVTACLNGYESTGKTVTSYVGNTVPTTAPVTTETTTTEALLEVIGMEVKCTADNTLEVVWGQDADRMNRGYKYNVYVNDVKVLSEVICNRYTIEDVDAGIVQVRVTATLNGKETQGVTQSVNVTGVVPTTISTEEPLEVIGMVVSSPADNTIGVVWGQDDERINNGQRYNVYVNGVKVLDEVICAYYTLENISSGTATVKVTAVLNGIESQGVVQTINVPGTK